MLKATITVRLKDGIDDPEGKSIRRSLELLGFEGISEVKVVKQYIIYMNCNPQDGKNMAEEMVKKLFVNPVIHSYDIRVEEI